MTLRYISLKSIGRLPTLDFTEQNGTDPLHIDQFFKNDLNTYMKSNLSRVWFVEENDKAIAYFTVSMSAIEIQKLDKLKEKVKGTTPTRYPAMLLGRMGVDKNHRGKQVGSSICKFCRGLAIFIGNRVACRYIILQTTQDKIPFYRKCGFIQSGVKPKNGLYWMYSRIV
ncbi:MAG: GNAT family N-acetyltransferase [Nitrososphaeraceae archaeon]